MKQKKSNLQKGINLMVVTLLLLILSPVVINMGFKAQQKLEIDYILYLGILLAVLTIILFALGIKTLLKHLFEQ